MPQQTVVTQRIWGAFTPTTNQIVGVQISGETPYQNVANALISTNFGGARLATNAATGTIFTQGKATQGDGAGAEFVYNPTDTTSGCVCTGTSAGTVLTVIAVSSGTVVVGQTLCSSVTGLPLATISSFGTGAGGVGTYNLSGPVTQASPITFLIDNNSTVLVSADGSRWYLASTTTTGPFTFNLPSGRPGITLTNTQITFGNATDNPNFSFAGAGTVLGPFTVSAGNFTSRGISDTATGNVLTLSGTGATAQLQGFGPTAGALQDMTFDSGSFTGTMTGCTAAINVPCRWWRAGKIVLLVLDSDNSAPTGTSNATTLGMTGLPAAIIPATLTPEWKLPFLTDNSAATDGGMQITPATGVLVFYKGTATSATSWTAAGNKGFNGAMPIVYPLL